ncbi:MAG: hypothetical protein Q9187_007226 [Circinaria calcarea]
MATKGSHTYTSSQLESYFERISLPARHRDLSYEVGRNNNAQRDLEFLTALQKHQLAAVPFENLSIHYSPTHTIDLDPGFLYAKIVTRRRGGYCMENNCFFGTVLRSLGFSLYSAGARVSEAAAGSHDSSGYLGWSHMVNIVLATNGNKYLVDVGFGGGGPIQPLPLKANEVSPGIPPHQVRLAYENIEGNSDPNQRLWIFQFRKNSEDAWKSNYCFTGLEFLPQDYEIMSFWTSQSRKAWFTHKIAVVMMVLEKEEVVGVITLVGGEVKRRYKEDEVGLKTCSTEDERIIALKEHFSIDLSEDDRRGIAGLVTELPHG